MPEPQIYLALAIDWAIVEKTKTGILLGKIEKVVHDTIYNNRNRWELLLTLYFFVDITMFLIFLRWHHDERYHEFVDLVKYEIYLHKAPLEKTGLIKKTKLQNDNFP